MARPYDPKNVNVVIDGVTMVAYAEDSFVKCERDEDRMIPYVGVKGEAALAHSAKNLGTITVTLQQGSPSNKKLQTLASNKTEFTTSVTDTNTNGFRAGGNECYILKEPPIERTGSISTREWTIKVLDYTQVET